MGCLEDLFVAWKLNALSGLAIAGFTKKWQKF